MDGLSFVLKKTLLSFLSLDDDKTLAWLSETPSYFYVIKYHPQYYTNIVVLSKWVNLVKNEQDLVSLQKTITAAYRTTGGL